MTSISEGPKGSSNPSPVHRARPGTGRFMLTLCRLAAPAAIRPPQSPQLQAFTFFTSREREVDGSEHLYLHLGYFETLADAERWVEGLRGRFPDAIATIAPDAFSHPPNAATSASAPDHSRAAAVPGSAVPPAKGQSLTDTQVLKILETRHASPVRDDPDQRDCDQIALLRPDDTSTRRAVKEAVIEGAPVSFAVQLLWSAKAIDLSHVPCLAIFKAYTLYATESRRQEGSRHFLRLGFFPDPISAKQFAAQVRANFSSAAVVPVTDEEVTRAREAALERASIPYLVQQRSDRPTDSNDALGSQPQPKPVISVRRNVPRGAETLKQTLERLAEREMLTDPDSLSESGVRHLKIDDMLERTPGRRSQLARGPASAK